MLYTIYLKGPLYDLQSFSLGGNNKQGDIMWRQLLMALGLVMQLGLTISFSGGIGWWLGLRIDARLGYNGIASTIGLIAGIVGGFIAAYRLLQRVLASGGFEDE